MYCLLYKLTKLKEMIKNYYYLVAGILAILFSITHAWNGQTVVLPSLHVEAITAETKTIFFYEYNQEISFINHKYVSILHYNKRKNL